MLSSPCVLVLLVLSAAAFSSSAPAQEHFNSAQVRVLHDFADYLLDALNSEELQAAAAIANMQRGGGMKAKRNSELLNSLLGLPKNILRSGRK